MAAAKGDQVAETSPVRNADNAQSGTAPSTAQQSAGPPAYQEPAQAERPQSSGSIATSAALGMQHPTATQRSSAVDTDDLQNPEPAATTSQADDEPAQPEANPEVDEEIDVSMSGRPLAYPDSALCESAHQPAIDVSTSGRPLLHADSALSESAQQPADGISTLGRPLMHADSALSESEQQLADGSSRAVDGLAEGARQVRQPLAVVQESYLPRQSSNAAVKQDAAARPSGEGETFMVLLSLASCVTNATIASAFLLL